MAHPAFRTLVQILSVIGVLMAALIAYTAFAQAGAERKARAFCESTKLGDSRDEVRERARTSGAEQHFAQWMNEPGTPRAWP